MQRKDEIKSFLKQAKAKAKTQKNIKSLDYNIVNLLYSNPVEFISQYKLLGTTIQNNEEVFDDTGTSIFNHYVIAMNEIHAKNGDHDAGYKALDDNLVAFFKNFMTFLPAQDNNGDTFLHAMEKRNHYDLIIQILNKFALELEIFQNLPMIKNKKGERFYDPMLSEINAAANASLGHPVRKKYLPQIKEVINILRNSFKCISPEETEAGGLKEERGAEDKNECEKCDVMSTDEKDVLLQLRIKSYSDMCSVFSKLIDEDYENFFSVSNLSELNFNIFNYFIRKNQYAIAETLFQKILSKAPGPVNMWKIFIHIPVEHKMKFQYDPQNLLFTIMNGHSNNNDDIVSYLDTLFCALSNDIHEIANISGQPIKDLFKGKFGRNIFHFLALNEHVSVDIKCKIFTIIEQFFVKIDQTDALDQLLSCCDKSFCVPLIYFLLNRNIHAKVELIENVFKHTRDNLFTGYRNQIDQQVLDNKNKNRKRKRLRIHPCECICEMISLGQSQELNFALKFLIEKNLFDPFILYKKKASVKPQTILCKIKSSNLNSENVEIIFDELILSGKFTSCFGFSQYGHGICYFNFNHLMEFVTRNLSKISPEKQMQFAEMIPHILEDLSIFCKNDTDKKRLVNYWTRSISISDKIEDKFLAENKDINENFKNFKEHFESNYKDKKLIRKRPIKWVKTFVVKENFISISENYPENRFTLKNHQFFIEFLNNMTNGEQIKRLIYSSFEFTPAFNMFSLLSSYLKLLNDRSFCYFLEIIRENYLDFVGEILFAREKLEKGEAYFIEFMWNIQKMVINQETMSTTNFSRAFEVYLIIMSYLPSQVLFISRILFFSLFKVKEKKLMFKYSDLASSCNTSYAFYEYFLSLKKVIMPLKKKQRVLPCGKISSRKIKITPLRSTNTLLLMLYLFPDPNKVSYYGSLVEKYLTSNNHTHLISYFSQCIALKGMNTSEYTLPQFNYRFLMPDFQATWELFSKELTLFYELKFLSILRNHMIRFAKNYSTVYYFKFLKTINSLLREEQKVLGNINKGFENYFLLVKPILTKKQPTLDEEIILLKNFALRKIQGQAQEKILATLFSNLKMYFNQDPDRYNSLYDARHCACSCKFPKKLFNALIKNKDIKEFLYSKHDENRESEYLLNIFLRTCANVYKNGKQDLLTFFSPNFIHDPSKFVIIISKDIISVNPFGFLLSKSSAKDIEESEMEVHANNLRIIVNECRNKHPTMMEIFSKYIQEDKSFFAHCASQGSSFLDELARRCRTFFGKCELSLMNEMMRNKSISEAFCALMYSFLDKYTHVYIKPKHLVSIVSLCTELNIYDYCNEYNQKFLVLMIKILTVLQGTNTNYIPIENTKKNLLTFHNEKVLYNNIQDFFASIYQILNCLLCFKDISLFDFYVKGILKLQENILRCFFKMKYFSSLFFSYFIYTDDIDNFSFLSQLLVHSNSNENERQQYFLNLLDLSNDIGFVYIKQQANDFTKFLFKYNCTTLYYLSLISSNNVLEKLSAEYDTFEDIQKQFNPDFERKLRYGLKYALFERKDNRNILEAFRDMIANSFCDQDYVMICRLFKGEEGKNYVRSLMQVFTELSHEKMFLTSVKVCNEDIAISILNIYPDKENLLTLADEDEGNIIQLLAIRNMHMLLKKILGIINSNFSKYKSLLFDTKTNNKTPSIYFTYGNRHFESFVLLYNFYSATHITHALRCVPDNVEDYFAYYENYRNRQFVRENARTLFVLSEIILQIRKFLIQEQEANNIALQGASCFIDKNSPVYTAFFQYLLSNPEYLNEETPFISGLVDLNNDKIFTQILYVIIDVLKVLPDEKFFDSLYIEGGEKTKSKHSRDQNEYNYLRIFSKLESVGFDIIPVNKYLLPGLFTKYPDMINIDQLNTFPEYQVMIRQRLDSYLEKNIHFNHKQKLSDRLIDLLFHSCYHNYSTLSMIVINEYNLLSRIEEIISRNSSYLPVIVSQFFSFYYLITYQMENVNRGNIFQISSDEKIVEIRDENLKRLFEQVQSSMRVDENENENENSTEEMNIYLNEQFNYNGMMYINFIFNFPIFVEMVIELLEKERKNREKKKSKEIPEFQKLDQIVKIFLQFNRLILSGSDFASFFKRCRCTRIFENLKMKIRIDEFIHAISRYLQDRIINSNMFFNNISYIDNFYQLYLSSPNSQAILQDIEQEQEDYKRFFREIDFKIQLVNSFLTEANFFLDSEFIDLRTDQLYLRFTGENRFRLTGITDKKEHFAKNFVKSIQVEYLYVQSDSEARMMRDKIIESISEYLIGRLTQMKFGEIQIDEKLRLTVPYTYDHENSTFIETLSKLGLRRFCVRLIDRLSTIIQQCIMTEPGPDSFHSYLCIFPEYFGHKMKPVCSLADLEENTEDKDYGKYLVSCYCNDIALCHRNGFSIQEVELKHFSLIQILEKGEINIKDLIMALSSEEKKIPKKKEKYEAKTNEERQKILCEIILIYISKGIQNVKEILLANPYLLNSLNQFVNNLDNYDMITFQEFLSMHLFADEIISCRDFKIFYPSNHSFTNYFSQLCINIFHASSLNHKFSSNKNFQGIIYNYDQYALIIDIANQNGVQTQCNYHPQLYLNKIRDRFYYNENSISALVMFYVNMILYQLHKQSSKFLSKVWVDFHIEEGNANPKQKEVLIAKDVDFSDEIVSIEGIDVEIFEDDINYRTEEKCGNALGVRMKLDLSGNLIIARADQEKELNKILNAKIDRLSFSPNEDYKKWSESEEMKLKIEEMIGRYSI